MTPRLRRYARALVSGSPTPCDIADTLVHATLMRAVGSRALGSAANMPIRLFATVTQLHRDLAPAERSEMAAGIGRRQAPGVASTPAPLDGLAASLLRLSLDEREALLLVTLESFDHQMAARILRISRPVLFERLTRARFALGESLRAPALAIPAQAARVPYLRLVVG